VKHTTRVERYILIDILVGACGASFGAAILQLSWKAGLLGAALAFAAYLLERETIEEEETPGKDNTVKLTEAALSALRQSAKWLPATDITEEDQPVYEEGLRTGAAELAKFVLEEIEQKESS